MRRFILAVVGLLAVVSVAHAQNTPNYQEVGGASWVIGDTGTLTVASGGTCTVSSGGILNVVGAFKIGGTTISGTAAEINSGTDGVANAVSLSAAAGSTNISNVTITMKDGAGGTVAAVANFDVWLSDASSCAGLTGTTASGTVQVKSASGVDLSVYSAKKAIHSQTLATGIYTLEITDSAKTTFWVCAQAPGSGAVTAVHLVTGNYG